MEEITKKTHYRYKLDYYLSDDCHLHSYYGGPFNSKDLRDEVLDLAVDLVNQVGGEVVQVRRIEEICYVSADK